MILANLFTANQYGTVPTVFDTKGTPLIVRGAACIYEGRSIPLDAPIIKSIRGRYYSKDYDIELNQAFLIPCTAENRLIFTAFADKIGKGVIREHPYIHFVYTKESYYVSAMFPQNADVRILDDGTGWIKMQRDPESYPVTFYMEDILYRLDLLE